MTWLVHILGNKKYVLLTEVVEMDKECKNDFLLQGRKLMYRSGNSTANKEENIEEKLKEEEAVRRKILQNGEWRCRTDIVQS